MRIWSSRQSRRHQPPVDTSRTATLNRVRKAQLTYHETRVSCHLIKGSSPRHPKHSLQVENMLAGQVEQDLFNYVDGGLSNEWGTRQWKAPDNPLLRGQVSMERFGMFRLLLPMMCDRLPFQSWERNRNLRTISGSAPGTRGCLSWPICIAPKYCTGGPPDPK